MSVGEGRLVIVAPTDYLQFPMGGTRAFLSEFLAALPSQIVRQTTLAGIATDTGGGALSESRQVGDKTFPFIRLGTWPGPQSGSIRMRFIKSLWSMWSAIRLLDPTTMYVHSVEAAAVCAARGYRGRLVLHCHGLENPMRLGRFHWLRGGPPVWAYDHFLLPFAIGRAKHIFATAGERDLSDFRARHPGLPEARLVQIPALVDDRAFLPMDREESRGRLGLSERSVVGIVVGRLEQGKGIQTVLDALCLLKREGLTVDLLVVGDGAYRQQLEELAERLGLQARTRFLGHVERRFLPGILSAGDVYLSGSWKEGFSMALVEALSCGLPAVVTNAGAAREVVTSGENGYVIPVGDAPAMAAGVRAVLEHQGGWTSRCRRSVTGFGSRAVVERMLPALGMAEAA